MRSARLGVAIVDYGVGNQTSVMRCVRRMGFRSWISNQPDQLDLADVLLLLELVLSPRPWSTCMQQV